MAKKRVYVEGILPFVLIVLSHTQQSKYSDASRCRTLCLKLHSSMRRVTNIGLAQRLPC